MLRKITILLCLLPSLLFAQGLKELRVLKNGVLQPDELVGLRDQNGNFCAAIKILSNFDGFSYDSNNGVFKVEDNPGEDIVFVTEGERVIQVYLSGYKPLRIILDEFGIYPRQKEMWVLEVGGEEDELLNVTILTKPEGGKISVDGKELNGGPVYSLTRGNHSLKVVKENYYTIEDSLIRVNEQNLFYNIELERIEDVIVQLQSNPTGATVFFDEIKIGTTPLGEFYKPGTYRLRIEKEGFQPLVDNNFEISKRTGINKSFDLSKSIGTVSINTFPNAKVEINNIEYTSYQNLTFEPQLLKVKVTMPKAEPLFKNVPLKNGDNLTLDLYPIVDLGSLRVKVLPFDTKVTLTGDAGEHYEAVGMKEFKDIPAGIYTAYAEKPGYFSTTETITVKKGEVSDLSFSLTLNTSLQDNSNQNNNTTNQRNRNITTEVQNKMQASNNTQTEPAKKDIPTYIPAATGETNDLNVELYQKYLKSSKKHNAAKNFWLFTTFASAGAGTYFYFEADKLYKEYQTSPLNAEDLRNKIEIYDMAVPACVSLAGVSLITSIIEGAKAGSAKKKAKIELGGFATPNYGQLSMKITF